MLRGILAFVFVLLATVRAPAQDVSWVQLQALPTLNAAQDAARQYSTTMENVNGFHLGSNWYGIALGPYTKADAEALLRDLRRTGTIPRDAFVSDGKRFGQQFWPIGTGAEMTPQPLPETVEAPAAEVAVEPAAAPEVEPEAPVVIETTLPEETLDEARASEAALTRGEREMLQIALKWAGFYNSSIDGAFGRGTRASMAAWQQDNGFDATGVLTTGQRAALIGAYNAILEGVDLAEVQDTTAGIAIQIPTGLVEFAAHDAPFARYGEKDGSGVQVLLISQPGDRTRLYGLYEILQTLDIVPTDGPRSRDGDSFTIDGTDATRHTFVTASVEGGEIKGFALIWPAGDEDRRTRVLENMQASFKRIGGLLDLSVAPDGQEQSIDLVSGLSIRKPQIARTGFFLDASGTVLTAAATVTECASVTLDDTHPATVVWKDDTLAVLRPDDRLAPMGNATIQTATPRLQSDVAVGGFPYGAALTLPTLTFGKLADVRGLDGNESVLRLDMVTEDGDIGGPVFDAGGAVIGVLLPATAAAGQVLPPNVSYAADSDAVMAALDAAGVSSETTDTAVYMPPETLTTMAADMTVLVSCW